MNKLTIAASTCLLFAMLLSPSRSNAQVLISLIFGDKLNSEKIEFGLKGGWNRSYLYDIPDSKGLNNFNLGFYFHILLKKNTFISTGVMVKSDVGASNISPYPTGNDYLDSLYTNGEVDRKIGYFYVPIMLHQRFNNRTYVEGGIQLGLRHRSKDIFKTSVGNSTKLYS